MIELKYELLNNYLSFNFVYFVNIYIVHILTKNNKANMTKNLSNHFVKKDKYVFAYQKSKHVST